MVIVMENLYFVAFIVFCAVILTALGLKFERKHRLKTEARRKQAHQKAQVHHRHETGAYHHIHGHLLAESHSKAEVWSARNQRAREEDKPGSTISATRVFGDEEAPDDQTASGLKMTSIEYTPELLNKEALTKR